MNSTVAVKITESECDVVPMGGGRFIPWIVVDRYVIQTFRSAEPKQRAREGVLFVGSDAAAAVEDYTNI